MRLITFIFPITGCFVARRSERRKGRRDGDGGTRRRRWRNGWTGAVQVAMRVVVQLPIGVTKISATQFRKAAAGSDAIRNLCVQYNEILLSQARVTAACNALHVIEARFCRWLLQSADRAGTNSVKLTQEFLAEMLGVRRTSVTEVASKIQKTGAINYSRGVITILDRAALEKMSCECYQTLLDQSAAIS